MMVAFTCEFELKPEWKATKERPQNNKTISKGRDLFWSMRKHTLNIFKISLYHFRELIIVGIYRVLNRNSKAGINLFGFKWILFHLCGISEKKNVS